MRITFLGDVFLQEDTDWRSGLPRELQGDALVLNFEYVYDDGTLGDKYATEGKINLKGKGNPFLQGCKKYIACMANNHALDYGSIGVESTLRFIKSSNAEAIGIERSDSSARRLVEIGDGVTLSAYLQAHMKTQVEGADGWHQVLFSEEKALADGRLAKTTGSKFHIVYLHWGTEFMSVPWPNQIEIAHRLIDSGWVDMIVGMHTHCRQPWEIYKGKYIFYSLGNSVFPDIRNAPSMFKDGIAVINWFDYWSKDSCESLAVVFETEAKSVQVMGCRYKDSRIDVHDVVNWDLELTRGRCVNAVLRRLRLSLMNLLHGHLALFKWHFGAAIKSWKSYCKTLSLCSGVKE